MLASQPDSGLFLQTSRLAMSIEQTIIKKIAINAPPSKIWEALTAPSQMKQWMSETEIEVITDWVEGRPMIIRGLWYKTNFENRGTVLQYQENRVLSYSHLSSLSRLPDEPGNYTNIKFALEDKDDQAELTLTLDNFPTEAIYRHFAFYWNVAIVLLKRFVESQQSY